MLKSAATSSAQQSLPRLQAIVSAIRTPQVVEFAFVYGDPDLSVELVLPMRAFVEFCSVNDCEISIPDDQTRSIVEPMLRRGQMTLVTDNHGLELRA